MMIAEEVRDRWCSLTKQSQYLVVAVVFLITVMLLVGKVERPVMKKYEDAKRTVESHRELLSWVEQQADTIISLRRGTVFNWDRKNSLNQIITSASARYGLRLVRLQPQRKDFQVWFEPPTFDAFVGFLDWIEIKYGIRVTTVTVRKSNHPGFVDIEHLTLGTRE